MVKPSSGFGSGKVYRVVSVTVCACADAKHSRNRKIHVRRAGGPGLVFISHTPSREMGAPGFGGVLCRLTRDQVELATVAPLGLIFINVHLQISTGRGGWSIRRFKYLLQHNS